MTLEWAYWALVILLLVYEGLTLANRRTGDTISEIHWRLAREYPIVPFALGVLMGHLFWRSC